MTFKPGRTVGFSPSGTTYNYCKRKVLQGTPILAYSEHRQGLGSTVLDPDYETTRKYASNTCFPLEIEKDLIRVLKKSIFLAAVDMQDRYWRKPLKDNA